MKTIVYAVISTLAILSISCSKVGLEPPVTAAHSGAKAQTIIASYPLNWDTGESDHQRMPFPSNTTIPSPWDGGGSVAYLEDNMKYDYHKSDGWSLVYNTFNTSSIPPYLYFVLYNRYRGLIRFYFYRYGNSNQGQDASSLLHTFKLSSGSSDTPFLNYAAKSIVGVGSNSRSVALAASGGVPPLQWYGVEFEIPYDENNGGKTVNLSWILQGLNDAKVALNGKESGTLSGKVAADGGGNTFSFTSGNSVNISNKGGNVTVSGAADDEASLINKLGSAALSGVTDAITAGVSGIVKGIFNGIFGTGETKETRLTLDSKIDLNGTISSTADLIAEEYPLSTGVSQYDKPYGLFYISNGPTIQQTTFHQPRTINGQPVDEKRSFLYTVDPNSFRLIWNTNVKDVEVDIQNIRYDAVLTGYDGGQHNFRGTVENIQGNNYLTGPSVGIQGNDNELETPELGVVGIRVSFEVVPRNGSRHYTVARTFLEGNRTFSDVNIPEGQSPW